MNRHPFLISAALSILAFGIYLIGFKYSPVGDSIPAELLPIAILRDHTFYFDAFAPDKQHLPYYFVAPRGDHVVSFYPIIPGLLNLPAYAIAKYFGVDLMEKRFLLSGITCAWITAVSVGCIYLALSKVCRGAWTAIFFAIVYAFATAAWSVTSRCLWQHGPSLMFLGGAIALLMFKNKRWTPYCGLLLGMAVWNRPANIVFALPIAIYMIIEYRDRLWPFVISGAIAAIGLLLYSQIMWGSVIALGQGHHIGGMHAIHPTNFSGPLLEGLAGVMISPNRGLFIFGPMFVFAIAYLLYALFAPRGKIDPLYRWLAIGVLLDVYLFSKWSVWWGGHSFGYRMLIETVPALMIFLAAAWQSAALRHWSMRALFILTIIVSAYISFLGAYYYPSGFNYQPNDIDGNQERLWSWRDGEIARCQAHFFADIKGVAGPSINHGN